MCVCVYVCVCGRSVASVLNKLALAIWGLPGQTNIFTKDCCSEVSVSYTTRSEHRPLCVN